VKLGVLVSGRGTNLGALLAAEAAGTLAPATIAVVISNRPDAPALERARAAGKPALTIDHKAFADRAAFERALVAELARHDVTAVVLAGFMRVLTSTFIDGFGGPIVNTHPALLPAFPGVDAPAQALAHGAKLTGVTVHFVDAGVDTGPIIAQRAVAIVPGDDAAALHQRIQREEHQLLPAAVQALAAGRLRVDGRVVTLRENDGADQLL
jgi:phosphoribosylglycinamide formyltransferase-1